MEIQWSLLLFSLIAGAGGSLLACVGASELLGFSAKSRVRSIAIALAMVIVGGVFSVFHLHQKANIMAAAANIGSLSPISVELIMVGTTLVVGIVYLVCVVREAKAGALKTLAVLGLVAGLLLGWVTGSGYQMGAQPLWNTPLLPLAYLGSDLALGALLYLSLALGGGDLDDEAKRPQLLGLVAGVVGLVACLAYGISTGVPDHAVLYWVGVAAASAIAVVFAVLLRRGEPKLAFALGGTVFALVAGVCLRAFMWLVGTGTLDLFADAAARLVL